MLASLQWKIIFFRKTHNFVLKNYILKTIPVSLNPQFKMGTSRGARVAQSVK